MSSLQTRSSLRKPYSSKNFLRRTIDNLGPIEKSDSIFIARLETYFTTKKLVQENEFTIWYIRCVVHII